MPWNVKLPDLKNNPLYLEPRVTAAESQLAEIATLNVKLPPYNAKTNGVDDDSLAIQQALNDAKTKGIKTVDLPSGYKYRIATKLVIDDNAGIILKGTGAGANVGGSLTRPEAFGTVLQNYTGGVAIEIKDTASIVHNTQVHLRDFVIENMDNTGAIGVFVNSGYGQIYIDNCYFLRGYIGLKIGDIGMSTFDVNILNCMFLGWDVSGDTGKYGIWYGDYPNLSVVRDTTIRGWETLVQKELTYSGEGPSTLYFDNILFESTTKNMVDLRNTYNIVMDHCHFEVGGTADPNLYYYLLFGNDNSTYGEGSATLIGCTFTGSGSNTYLYAGKKFKRITLIGCEVGGNTYFAKFDSTGYSNDWAQKSSMVQIIGGSYLKGFDLSSYQGRFLKEGTTDYTNGFIEPKLDKGWWVVTDTGNIIDATAWDKIWLNPSGAKYTTTFSGGEEGREIEVYFQNGNVDVDPANGAANIVPASGERTKYPANFLTRFVYVNGKWREIAGKAMKQSDSVASDVATLKNDFNALLTKLRNGGVMGS